MPELPEPPEIPTPEPEPEPAPESAPPARYALRHFGREDARPKVTEYYTPQGWQPIWDKSLRLSPESAQLIRDRGIVMVRVRHRFKTTEVPLVRYLEG
ncbi:hypothetical protein [Gryllotalpicola ginsengisoli]|uniref:hypothetical protein n=1 Tax=Gryllotalpicola ginsengisoli TaxID=444608 RepID=UPI0003B36DDE|nr:hypothetical protein [Gryllotalpicola ginsengisoli]